VKSAQPELPGAKTASSWPHGSRPPGLASPLPPVVESRSNANNSSCGSDSTDRVSGIVGMAAAASPPPADDASRKGIDLPTAALMPWTLAPSAHVRLASSSVTVASDTAPSDAAPAGPSPIASASLPSPVPHVPIRSPNVIGTTPRSSVPSWLVTSRRTSGGAPSAETADLPEGRTTLPAKRIAVMAAAPAETEETKPPPGLGSGTGAGLASDGDGEGRVAAAPQMGGGGEMVGTQGESEKEQEEAELSEWWLSSDDDEVEAIEAEAAPEGAGEAVYGCSLFGLHTGRHQPLCTRTCTRPHGSPCCAPGGLI